MGFVLDFCIGVLYPVSGFTPTNELTPAAVLQRTIDWEHYRENELLSDRSLQVLSDFDHAPADDQLALLEDVRFM